MSEEAKQAPEADAPSGQTDLPDQSVEITEDQKFRAEVEVLIREAEDMRIRYMQKHRSSVYFAMTAGMIILLLGAGGFGWFLLMEADLVRALASIILALVLPLLMHVWSNKPLKEYAVAYKRDFMPKMAKALGGLKFHPSRGISAKIIAKTGVIPPHDSYEAEDCFTGRRKDVKLIMSEARLLSKKSHNIVFQGLFALMELPQPAFQGHTIVTGDREMAQSYAGTRWKKLQTVGIHSENPEWDRFMVFSDKPEDAQRLVGEKLLKELSEVSDIFGKTPVTAVFFREKYIFMMIPSDRDMFEASNMYVPVTTRDHAMTCKKELERLIEIIDVLDIYQNT